MNITTSELKAQYDRLGHHNRVEFKALGAKYGGGFVNESLLIAIGSRETNCVNEVGDFGHGRGMFQIDDRSHAALLHHLPGCRSGTDKPVPHHTALDPGFCPTVAQGALQACHLLVSNYEAARHLGYKDHDARRIAIAAYNGGLGGALSGMRQHGNPDAYTTGHDYSADTLERQRAVHGFAA